MVKSVDLRVVPGEPLIGEFVHTAAIGTDTAVMEVRREHQTLYTSLGDDRAIELTQDVGVPGRIAWTMGADATEVMLLPVDAGQFYSYRIMLSPADGPASLLVVGHVLVELLP